MEADKLIAKFMGYKLITPAMRRNPETWSYSYWERERNHPLGKSIVGENDLNFKTWSRLMPVVEKIESIHDEHHGYFVCHIHSNACDIQGTNLWKALEPGSTYGQVYMSDPNAILGNKIESTYYNVVEFIKWYNQQKP